MPDTHSKIPALGTLKGVQYFAKTSDGQWHYINHAGTWQTCPAPINTSKTAIARALLGCMDDHGGVEDFCEKLQGFPEQYCTDLAITALEELSVKGRDSQ